MQAVGIWKEATGRGPDFAQAYAGNFAIGMVFRGVLTAVELKSVERGDIETVREMRRGIFQASRDELIKCVEAESHRKVATVLYDVSPEDDTSAFTFVLEPNGE